MATKVTGRALLRAKLAKLPKVVQANLQAEITKSAEDMANLMRSRAPVRSGALRDSIKVTNFSRGGIGAVITAGGAATTKPVRNGQSATYDYALANELGTQDMLAQPFFYPSYRQRRPKVRRGMTKAVKAAIEEVAPTPR